MAAYLLTYPSLYFFQWKIYEASYYSWYAYWLFNLSLLREKRIWANAKCWVTKATGVHQGCWDIWSTELRSSGVPENFNSGLSEGDRGLTGRVCQFLWCKYSTHGWFCIASVMSQNVGPGKRWAWLAHGSWHECSARPCVMSPGLGFAQCPGCSPLRASFLCAAHNQSRFHLQCHFKGLIPSTFNFKVSMNGGGR